MKENSKEDIFEKMPIFRALMTLAVPAIIGQLIVLVYNIADTFFIGRTDNPCMVAGATLILPLFNMTVPLANVAGVGGGTLVSRLLGIHKNDDASRVSASSIWISLGFAVFFSVMIGLFMNPVLRALGASDEVLPFARQYVLTVVVLGGVPCVMSNTFAHMLRNTGYSKQAGFGVSMGGILNIILDPLFMFVLLPEGSEVLGAGIATMLSNIITCSYFLIMYIRLCKTTVLSLSLKNGWAQRGHICEMFFVGVPAALNPLMFDIDYMVLSRLMSGYGDVALAAVGIVLKAERLATNIGVGLCMGMTPLVAYNYSAGNYKRMDGAVRYARYSGMVTGAAAILCYELFAPQVMRIFINDPETVAIGTEFLKVRALATVFMFLSFYIVNFFQAVGKGPRALLLGFFRWIILNIPMMFVLNRLWGNMGIVWSQFIADVICTIVSYFVYVRFVKKEIHLKPDDEG